jgi:hypothetical protein
MERLIKLSKRISEIGCEIKSLKSQREINLEICHGSEDKDFDGAINKELYDNCLTVSYQWSKNDREEAASESECSYAPWGSFYEFSYILKKYGCKNCIAAYKAKQDIGKLRMERGRIVGNISKIGSKL